MLVKGTWIPISVSSWALARAHVTSEEKIIPIRTSELLHMVSQWERTRHYPRRFHQFRRKKRKPSAGAPTARSRVIRRPAAAGAVPGRLAMPRLRCKFQFKKFADETESILRLSS